MSKYSIAVVGCGNVGASAVQAVLQAVDMELVGIVEKAELCETMAGIYDCPVVDSIAKVPKPDGVVLAIPSTLIPVVAPDYLRQGIATSDSYDLHGQPLLDTLGKLETAAKEGQVASVSSAGWDPGTDSLIRAIFKIMAPQEPSRGPGCHINDYPGRAGDSPTGGLC